MLFKDNVIDKSMKFDMNGSNEGINILHKLSRDTSMMINYNNLFFKTGNGSIENFNLFKRLDTLYDLLIDLLNGKIIKQ